MYDGNVGGVSGNSDAQWNKKLAEELDALDGVKDGNIKANIWNGFIEKTGSKGNKIHNFIRLNNAERSFNYYDRKKDVGLVDWKNWESMLNEFKKDLGIEIHGDNGGDDGGDEVDPDTKVTPEQQSAFNELESSGAIALKKFDAASLKENGFGVVKANEHMQADEDGLYYMLDMNGGKNYFNEKGESIRISEFEATIVEGGKVEVTTASADGKVKNSIIYGENDKPLSGYAVVTNEDNSSVIYKYEFDADGKKVLKECTTTAGNEEAEDLTEAQREEFRQNSPIKDIKTSADFDNFDLSNYEWHLLNYQGTGYYINDATGERIDVERSYGLGGYKNLSIAYTKDGITHEIKFDDDGNITSNEVKKAGTLPEPPVIGDNTTPTLENLQEAVAQLPVGKFNLPTEEELTQAGYVKNETMMTGNGGILYENPTTGEAVILTAGDRTLFYGKDNIRISQFYDETGKLAGGNISMKGENGAFATGVYEKDAEGNMVVILKQSHKAPAGSIEFANDGITGHQANINKFREELGLPDDFRFELPPLTHSDNYHGEHESDDGIYLTKVDVDTDGNVKISYWQKQADGTFKELGNIKLEKILSEGSLRGYDYKFTAHNNSTGYDTTVSGASWDDFS